MQPLSNVFCMTPEIPDPGTASSADRDACAERRRRGKRHGHALEDHLRHRGAGRRRRSGRRHAARPQLRPAASLAHRLPARPRGARREGPDGRLQHAGGRPDVAERSRGQEADPEARLQLRRQPELLDADRRPGAGRRDRARDGAPGPADRARARRRRRASTRRRASAHRPPRARRYASSTAGRTSSSAPCAATSRCCRHTRPTTPATSCIAAACGTSAPPSRWPPARRSRR
jgi:hypothetical protein